MSCGTQRMPGRRCDSLFIRTLSVAKLFNVTMCLSLLDLEQLGCPLCWRHARAGRGRAGIKNGLCSMRVLSLFR